MEDNVNSQGNGGGNDAPQNHPFSEKPAKPTQNVTVRKAERPAEGGEGYVTIGDGAGKHIKVRVANINAPVEELAKIDKVQSFAKQHGIKKLKVTRRAAD